MPTMRWAHEALRIDSGLAPVAWCARKKATSKVSAISPAAALDVLEYGTDAAGREAKAQTSPATNQMTSGSGKEPDGGAARLVRALKDAEVGSFDMLWKAKSLQDKRVALDESLRMSNRYCT